jgi:hypothetical protein
MNPPRSKRRCTIGLLVSLLGAGCTGPGATPQGIHEAPVATASDASDRCELTSSEGTYRVVFRPAPGNLPLNDYFSLDVEVLEGARGVRIDQGIDLSVDAAMPAHRHGMTTRPKVVRRGDGTFSVSGLLLHMSGVWELYFDVTRAGRTERAQIWLSLE